MSQLNSSSDNVTGTVTVVANRTGIVGPVNTRSGIATFILDAPGPDAKSKATVSIEVAADLVGDQLALPDTEADRDVLGAFLAHSVVTSDVGRLDTADIVGLKTPTLAGERLQVKNVWVQFDETGYAECPRAVAEQIRESRVSKISELSPKSEGESPKSPLTPPTPPVVNALSAPKPVSVPTPTDESDSTSEVSEVEEEPTDDEPTDAAPLEKQLSKEATESVVDDAQAQLEARLLEVQREVQTELQESAEKQPDNVAKTETQSETKTEGKTENKETAAPSAELIALVMPRPAKALAEAGYPTIDAAKAAAALDVQTLIDINGVSDATVKKILES